MIRYSNVETSPAEYKIIRKNLQADLMEWLKEKGYYDIQVGGVHDRTVYFCDDERTYCFTYGLRITEEHAEHRRKAGRKAV